MLRLAAAVLTSAVCALAPAGALAAPTPAATELLLVDTATGKLTGQAKLGAYASDLCWGPRGFEALVERPARGRRDATRLFVAYAPGRPTRVVRRPGKEEEVFGAAFAPGCARVAELHYAFAGDAQGDGGILVRDAAGKELLRVESDRWPEDPQIVWSRDGARVATSLYERGRGRTIRVYEAATGALVNRFSAPPGLRDLGGFSRDGSTLVVAMADAIGYGRHDLLDVVTGRTRPLIDAHTGRSLDGLAWSPTAAVLAARNDGGGIELLDPAVGYGPTLSTLALRPTADLTWSPDGARIAYVHEAGRDGRRSGIAVVDARPGVRPRRLFAPGRRALDIVGWSPDGRSLAVVRSPAPTY